MIKKQSKKSMENNVIMYIGIIGVFALAIVAVIMFFSQPPVEFTGKISCNTGFVGLDVSSSNRVQAYPCDDKYRLYNGANLTCFKTDNILNHINVKNIDGLNCNVEYNGKGSSALMWAMLRWMNYDVNLKPATAVVSQ